jgi:hypothetical protein
MRKVERRVVLLPNCAICCHSDLSVTTHVTPVNCLYIAATTVVTYPLCCYCTSSLEAEN